MARGFAVVRLSVLCSLAIFSFINFILAAVISRMLGLATSCASLDYLTCSIVIGLEAAPYFTIAISLITFLLIIAALRVQVFKKQAWRRFLSAAWFELTGAVMLCILWFVTAVVLSVWRLGLIVGEFIENVFGSFFSCVPCNIATTLAVFAWFMVFQLAAYIIALTACSLITAKQAAGQSFDGAWFTQDVKDIMLLQDDSPTARPADLPVPITVTTLPADWHQSV